MDLLQLVSDGGGKLGVTAGCWQGDVVIIEYPGPVHSIKNKHKIIIPIMIKKKHKITLQNENNCKNTTTAPSITTTDIL